MWSREKTKTIQMMLVEDDWIVVRRISDVVESLARVGGGMKRGLTLQSIHHRKHQHGSLYPEALCSQENADSLARFL